MQTVRDSSRQALVELYRFKHLCTSVAAVIQSVLLDLPTPSVNLRQLLQLFENALLTARASVSLSAAQAGTDQQMTFDNPFFVVLRVCCFHHNLLAIRF